MIMYGCLATGTASLRVPSLVRLPYSLEKVLSCPLQIWTFKDKRQALSIS